MTSPDQSHTTDPAASPRFHIPARPPAEGLLRTLRTPEQWVSGFAWSPDGATLVAATGGAALSVFDAASGDVRARWPASASLALGMQASPQSRCVWSPDGACVASFGAGLQITLWDAATGAPRATLDGQGGHITAVAFDRAGALLAATSFGGFTQVWDVATAGEVASAQAGDQPLQTVAFSPDGATLITGGADGRLICWEPRTLAQRASLIAYPRGGNYNESVDACAFSRDDAILYTLAQHGEVKAWDVADWQPRASVETHILFARTFALSPDGALLAVPNGQRLALFDVATGAALATFAGHAARIEQCAFSPDGALIASCASDGAIRMWDATARVSAAAPPWHPGAVRHIVYSPDGALIATDSRGDTKLRLWDGVTGDLHATLDVPGYGVGVLPAAWSPDATALITTGAGSEFILWDVASRTQRATLTGHRGQWTACAFSPDGTLIATTAYDGTLRLWDAATAEPRAVCAGHSGGVTGCAFSPDGALIATRGAPTDTSVVLWDAGSGKQRGVLNHEDGDITALAWSPDGATLAATQGNGALTFWDPPTGARLATLPAGQRLESCAYAPDGETLLALGATGALLLWDMRTGARRGADDSQTGSPSSYAWLPDGALVTASAAQGVRLWETATARQFASATLAAPATAMATHPTQPLIAIGDATGEVSVATLADYAAGPTIVTAGAAKSGDQAEARCPTCRSIFTVAPEQLGHDLVCPAAGCGARLRLNPFAVPPLSSTTPTLPGAEGRQALLSALGQAITQESSALSQRPQMLFQQVYNRLQWANPPAQRLVEAERARRKAEGAAPWLRAVSAPSESPCLIRTVASNLGGVVRCAFSPDGRALLTTSGAGALTLWDVASGRRRLTMPSAGGVYGGKIAFSPDGHTIVSAGDFLWLLDAATGAVRARLEGHTETITAIAYNPNGATLASVSRDGTLRLWDAQSGAIRHLMQVEAADFVRERAERVGGQTNTRLVAFSGDGALVLAGGLTGAAGGEGLLDFVRVYDVASGVERGGISLPHDPFQRSELLVAGFSADASTLYEQVAGQQPLAWRTSDWQTRPLREGEELDARRAVYPQNFSPDGKLTVEYRNGGKLLAVIEVASGERRTLIYGHSRGVTSVAWSPDSAAIATTGGEGDIKMWSVAAAPADGRPTWLTRNEEPTFARHDEVIWAMSWSPDGTTLATASKDKTIRLWDTDSHQPRGLQREADAVHACAYSPDGALLVYQSRSQMDRGTSTKVWRTNSAQQPVALTTRTGVAHDIAAFAWRPDSRILATAHTSGALTLWDFSDDAVRPYIPPPAPANKEALFEALAEQTPVRTTLHAPADMSLSALCWSPDGRRIAANAQFDAFTRQGYWLVWDVQSGALTYTLPAGRDSARLQFSPDGALVVTPSDALSLGVWDAHTGRWRGRLAYSTPTMGDPDAYSVYGSPFSISFAGWSDDGETIYTGGKRERAAWDVHTLERRPPSARLDAIGDGAGSMEATATSPDGRTLFAVSHQQRTLTVRDVASGVPLATLILPYGQRAIALHPWLPRLATVDDLGDITFLDLEDRTPGPLLVSVDREDGQGEARCPVCRQTFAVSPDQIGGDVSCPHDGCGARLRLSPFVLQATGEVFQGESAAPADFAFSPLPEPFAPPRPPYQPPKPPAEPAQQTPPAAPTPGVNPAKPIIPVAPVAPAAPQMALPRPAPPAAPQYAPPRPPQPPYPYRPPQGYPQGYPPPYGQRPPMQAPYPPQGYDPSGAVPPPQSYPAPAVLPARPKKRPWWMFWRRG